MTIVIGPEATVSLREITETTVYQIIKMSDTLSETQKKMVAPNAFSLSEAHFNEFAWFRAIYADETPVGFAMLYDDHTKPEYYLWRFMIAGPHQGKGFGGKAITLLVEYVKTRPDAKEFLLSVVPGEGSPEAFYRKHGFELTGKIEEGEKIMKLVL